MFVLVEDRAEVGAAYVAGLEREGISAVNFDWVTFADWFQNLSDDDLMAVQAVVAGEVAGQQSAVGGMISSRTEAPLIGLVDRKTLNETLGLLNAGFDDVLAKPVHVREIIARANAIRRRARTDVVSCGELSVFADGRDPVVGGAVLPLPRRELRILECLVMSRSAWLTKSQIFGRVYGILNDRLDESVIESHVCRLRRRLRMRLGYDPIESQRFLGYRMCLRGSWTGAEAGVSEGAAVDASSVQPLTANLEWSECCAVAP